MSAPRIVSTPYRTGEVEPGACLRCNRTLIARELADASRWTEFCEPCRERLKTIWPVEHP